MENDADSVALMSMYTEIRRKAGYTVQPFRSFPIFNRTQEYIPSIPITVQC